MKQSEDKVERKRITIDRRHSYYSDDIIGEG